MWLMVTPQCYFFQIDVLAEVVSAVRGSEVEVYLDGGVRQGTDVLKALAMGARAVFVGRPVLWGLAYAGREGVEQVLHMLTEELTLAMQLAGKSWSNRKNFMCRAPQGCVGV